MTELTTTIEKNVPESQHAPIIPSLLWTDLYKLTMGQAVWRYFPEVQARYQFIDRNGQKYPKYFAAKMRDQVDMIADLQVSSTDKRYLNGLGYLQPDFVDWFSKYRFNPNEINIEQWNGELRIDVEGPWARTIYWEVPQLTTTSTLFYQEMGQKPDPDFLERAREKGKFLKAEKAKLLEFGTRRAFSPRVHREVLEALIESAEFASEGGSLLGTSNVALAKEFGIPVSGTYAHEWVMGMAAMFGVEKANEKAMEIWAKEYLGADDGPAFPKLGTALIDTYTTDVFLRSFTKEQARFFPNLRQDSGDPLVIAEKIIRHLISLKEKPKEHGVVFSDGLNMRRIAQISSFLDGRINAIFGVGTNLTNDVGADPLNIVMKLFGIKLPGESWIPTAKISDDVSKSSGESRMVDQIFEELGLENPKKLNLVSVKNT